MRRVDLPGIGIVQHRQRSLGSAGIVAAGPQWSGITHRITGRWARSRNARAAASRSGGSDRLRKARFMGDAAFTIWLYARPSPTPN